MTNIVKSISQLIETQFPQIYRQDGAELVAFIEAYYEFLETSGQATKLSREMFDANDIDKTLAEFVVHFKEKYLKDFPFIAATDKRFLIKNIIDLYSSKGSERSIKLLMKMLFGEDVDVYYPGQDIFKPSDSTWFLPKYIELSYSPRTKGFVNQQITGGISGATAFVESVVTKRIDGRIIDILYLSSIKGNFAYGEFITDDGDLTNAPKITGSMTDIAITNGGQGNAVGDIFNVQSQGGRQGQIRVTAISNETGRVNFELVDGGAGYTLNAQQAIDAGHENFLSTSTNVYISDRVLTYRNKKYTRQEIYNELNYIRTLYSNNSVTISGFDAITLTEWYLGQGPSSEGNRSIFEFLISIYWNSGSSSYFFKYDFDENGSNSILSIASNGYLLGVIDGTYDTILKDYLLDYSYLNFEKVTQPKETISMASADDIKANISLGDYIYGYDGGTYSATPGSELAQGVVIKYNDNTANSSYFDVVVQPISGTFMEQTLLECPASDFTEDNVGETIDEATTGTLTIEYDTANTFSDGDTVIQRVYEYQGDTAGSIEVGTTYTILEVGNTDFTIVGATVNTVGTVFLADDTFANNNVEGGTGTVRSASTPYYISSYGEGVISGAPTEVSGIYTLNLVSVYGDFQKDSGDVYTIESETGDVIAWTRTWTSGGVGARGRIAAVTATPTATDIYIEPIYGIFDAGNEVRGSQSFFKTTPINVQSGQGAADVYLNNVETANGIIYSVEDTSAIGYVTGQNSSSVGLHSVVGDFLSSDLTYTFTAYEIATQIIRIFGGLTTPSNSKYQSLFDDLSTRIDGNGVIIQWTLADAENVLKSVSLSGNKNVDDYLSTKFYINTTRDTLISPPKYANGTTIELQNVIIDNVSEGENASFEPGSLENEENIYLYTDLLGDENVNGVRFTDIEFDGTGSGVGFLDSVDVIHYELKKVDGSGTSNRRLYIIDTYDDLSASAFIDGDGLSLARLDGTTVASTDIEVVDATWVNYDVGNATSTLNKFIIAVDASVSAPLPCEVFTGPAPTNLSIGIKKCTPIGNVITENSYIVQGDYGSVNINDAKTYDDVSDISSGMYGNIIEWIEDGDNTRVYLRLANDSSGLPLFQNTDLFTTSWSTAADDFYIKLSVDLNTIAYIRLGRMEVIDTRFTGTMSSSVEFTGGGFAGGDALQPASATISLYNGYWSYVTADNPGSNYYSDPVITSTYAWDISTWNATGTTPMTKPLLRLNVDYGYGFPFRPHGDHKTPLEDILKQGTFTIGSITSLTNINPGQLYNADPFINVYNPYIAAYRRADYIFKIDLISDNGFLVGETVYQTVSNIQTSKGTILEARADELVMERTNFNMTISDGYELVGGTSGARATVTSILNLDTNYWGTNAVVTGDVVVAKGVATGLEIVSSGFGYNQDEEVTMVSANGSNEFVITGTADLINQGIGNGFWSTYNSHLNFNKKIRDNDFYQEFSYQVLSGQSINRYEQILKDTLHVAGTKMFGGVVYESAVSGAAKVESYVDQVALVEVQLVDENDVSILGDGLPLLATIEVIRTTE